MIRVAILGAGIGAEHLRAYDALADRFAVGILCDLDVNRATLCCEGRSGVNVMADMKDALASTEIDLVDICLPPHLHADAILASIAAGKHAICEKPLVRSLAEMDRVEAALEASDRRVFPVFQYRYGPAFAALDALVAHGLAGPPRMAALETHWNRGADYYAVPWRGTWAGEAGGAVLGHAIHAHDLVCRYFGPVVSVDAAVETLVNDIETEDCAALTFRFANGALATSSVTLGSARDETRLRFVFRDLTATSGHTPYSPATGNWRFEARDPARQSEVDEVVAAHSGARAGFEGFLADVAAALDGQETGVVTVADGRASIELVTAIYAAARSGTRSHLPLPAAHPLRAGWIPGKGSDEGPWRAQ